MLGKTRKTALATATIALLGTGVVHNHAQSAPLDVSATIEVACDVSVAQNLGFGTVNSQSSGASTTQGLVNLSNCTSSNTAITIDSGSNVANGSRNLLRTNGTETVAYTISESANGLGSWGLGETKNLQTTIGGSVQLAFDGQLSTTDLGNAPAGGYTDTVEVTVSFATN